MFKYYLIIFISTICASNIANATNVYDKYILKAEEQKLYENNEWLSLLHYKKGIFTKYKSIIDTKSFFKSENGKTNPKEELNETIKSFFNTDITETEDKQHPICQFPARFDFINRNIKFDKKDLPKVNCERFKKFYNEIDPESISIIFPTTYMNNPASMFGHTLIRIDKKGSFKNNTHINSIIVNYGANTGGETSGIIYAFRGVFGLYKGFFSAMPYYKMTNEYGNLENRDIWEYKLNYTQEEAIFYTKHMWELIFADVNYYFFKENCSYLILETLNVLRPDIDLTKEFKLYTAPIDTIKTLKRYNMIVDKNYRPSLQKQIENNEIHLSRKERKIVKNIVYDKEIEKIEEKQDLIYDTAYKFLQYNKVKGKIDLNFYRKQSIKILKNINTSAKNEYKIKMPISPDNGHKIGKLGLSFGRKNENFLQFDFKPSYHELIDRNDGFDSHSEISFFNLSARYYFDQEKIKLNKLDLIKIKSLAVQDSFFKPMSFTVQFGLDNIYNNYTILTLDVNGGITLGNDLISVFALIGPKASYSGKFDENGIVGMNGVVGTFLNFNNFKLITDYKVNKLIKNKYSYDQLSFDANIFLTKDLTLNFNYRRLFYRKFENSNDFSVGIKLFF